MRTAEHLAKEILLEKKGVYSLVWDNKGELVRALLTVLAVFDSMPIKPMFLDSTDESIRLLKKSLDIQPNGDINESRNREEIRLFFLQQATSGTTGPWLNGWRSYLAKAPGTLIVIRNADFTAFQRKAPDLASFVGPKIFETANMLSLWRSETYDKIEPVLPEHILEIINRFPGNCPSEKEIAEWIKQHPPIDIE